MAHGGTNFGFWNGADTADGTCEYDDDYLYLQTDPLHLSLLV